MNPSANQVFHPSELLRLARTYRLRWMVPAALVATVAVAFALFRPATWQASQALIVRNEATGNPEGLGRFSHSDQMKTLQETILEVARSRGVLEAALAKVGPPSDYRGAVAAWPTPEDVEDLREALTLSPPKGTEFGETEIFYLSVKDHDRTRAVALAGEICDQLDRSSQQLRDRQATSMVHELAKTVDLARADLDESNRKLSQIEREVGPDLAELRVLNDGMNGESALRRTESEIQNELRQARATQQANRELLALLESAKDDPGQLLAAPSRLLESQPSLRRLKDGLVDAQLQTANLRGRMSDLHPAVIAARESEREIGRHLHDELAIAIRGLAVEQRLDTERIAMLRQQQAEITGRMRRLAELRAPYASLLAETNHRTELVKEAERNLAQARATQAGADAASLIARIDAPDTGVRPLGPGRATIALAGIVGGLAVGLGLLLLTAPAHPTPEAVATPEPVITPQPVADPRRVPSHVGRAAPTFTAGGALSLADALRQLSAR